jgi:hypothetical protein
MISKAWRIWAKAIGQKDGRNDREADAIALIRTGFVLITITANIMIMAGIVRHW